VQSNASVGLVELLLSAGAHIDGADDDGWTPTFAATWARNVDLLAVLLAHRPNLELKEKSCQQTALQYALSFGEALDSVSVMLTNAGAALDGASQSSLCRLASKGTSTIQALLNRGVAVNQLRDDEDKTPLHAIASCGAWSADSEAAANMLINVCGVDVNAQSFNGAACIHVAARGHGTHEALRWFIAAGADVNCVNHSGQTALHRVSSYESCVLLLAAGANVNARDRSGRTAFQGWLAISMNWNSIVHAFVAAGVDPIDIRCVPTIDADQVEQARRDIAKTRLDFVRHRAMQVCVGLQSLRLDALQMCEILQHSCGPVAHLIAFHQWWKIATSVKHILKR
jgi:ankyrin repeat protein